MNLTILAIILITLIVIFWYSKPDNVFREYYYFDNNGTTEIAKSVKSKMISNMKLGNASAIYSNKAKIILLDTTEEILDWVQSPKYKVVFTSCGSEGINTIIQTVVNNNINPHVVTSSVEHKTTLDCCKYLSSIHKADISYLPVDSVGKVEPSTILQYLRPNTCLVTIIHGNNETGAINDIKSIVKEVKKYNDNIIVHVDAVQTFGKMPILMEQWGVDVISLSGHKFNGPLGIGAIIISPHIKCYPLICGSQNDGMRGGTENIPGIAGLGEAVKLFRIDRDKKNEKMRDQIEYIYNYIYNNLPENYMIKRISPNDGLPNTLLFSICHMENDVNTFCNVKFKEKLFKNDVVVSIGSACNSKSKFASHVVKELGLDDIWRKGVIRISVGDFTKWRECKNMVRIFVKLL